MKREKRKITTLLLALALCASLAVPVWAGDSEKAPELATAGAYKTIATDFDSGYAIRNDGSLWAWGSEYGGVDAEGYNVDIDRDAPERIMDDAVSVRTMGNSTFVIKSDGSLWSWGYQGSGGILGDDRQGNTSYRNSQGYIYHYRLEPAKIMDDVSAVCAEIDRDFAFAIKKDGSLWGWGSNEAYQLGDGTQETRFIPGKIMDDVNSVWIANDDGGFDVLYDLLVYAVKTDGSLWKWGTDFDGVRGDDNVIGPEVVEEFKTPVEVTEGAAEIIASFNDDALLDADGNFMRDWQDAILLTDVVAYADSGYGDYLALKKDGTLWCKGRNGGGEKDDSWGYTYYPEFTQILSDVRLPDAEIYAVTFDGNGGTPTSQIRTVTATAPAITLGALPAAPTRSNYNFGGWSTSANGSGGAFTADTPVEADITVYAQWTFGGGQGGSSSGGGGGGGSTPAAQTAPAANETAEESQDTPATGAWNNPFTDVKSSDWFYGDVEYAVTNGLFAGTGATAFSPNTAMTRGMLVTVLGRLHGTDTDSYTASGFDDVAAAQYYAPYVEWAKQNSIVSGTGGNNFSPDAEITRQDMAVVLYRYMEYANINLPVTEQYVIFADEADISDYAKNAIQVLNKLGIINGVGAGAIDPQGKATRAQVAAMLHRFAEAVQ